MACPSFHGPVLLIVTEQEQEARVLPEGCGLKLLDDATTGKVPFFPRVYFHKREVTPNGLEKRQSVIFDIQTNGQDD